MVGVNHGFIADVNQLHNVVKVPVWFHPIVCRFRRRRIKTSHTPVLTLARGVSPQATPPPTASITGWLCIFIPPPCPWHGVSMIHPPRQGIQGQRLQTHQTHPLITRDDCARTRENGIHTTVFGAVASNAQHGGHHSDSVVQNEGSWNSSVDGQRLALIKEARELHWRKIKKIQLLTKKTQSDIYSPEIEIM